MFIFLFIYRVAHLVADLGWLDLDFECSTVCPILPGLMGIWQKGLGKTVEHRNPSQPSPGPRPDGPPCIIFDFAEEIRPSFGLPYAFSPARRRILRMLTRSISHALVSIA